MRPTSRLLLPVVSLLFAFPAVSFGEDYIGQTHIDTTVQRALYYLTAAADGAEIGLTMEIAIDRAKQISRRLRKLAETDVNGKYILWKVKELDRQIYLEEKGQFDQAANQRQRSVNDLVVRFNARIGHRRPDLALLEDLADRAASVDPAKASEMDRSLLDRKRSIAKEVCYVVENALDDGNFAVARTELAYLSANRSYLGITIPRYARLEARLQARVSVDHELAFIDKSSDQADNALQKLDLGEAQSCISRVGSRLRAIKSRTRQREWDKRHFRIKRQEWVLQRKEDSLVTCATRLLETKGIYDASEYLDKTLKKHGVSHVKIASVNQAITQVALAQGREEDSGEFGAELAALTADSPDSASGMSLLGELRAAAMTKAEEDTRGGVPAREGERVSRVEQARRRGSQVSQENIQYRQEARRRQLEEKAQQEILLVYTYLEKGEIDKALKQFERVQKDLKEYLSAQDIKALDSSITGSR